MSPKVFERQSSSPVSKQVSFLLICVFVRMQIYIEVEVLCKCNFKIGKNWQLLIVFNLLLATKKFVELGKIQRYFFHCLSV